MVYITLLQDHSILYTTTQLFSLKIYTKTDVST